MDLSLSFYKVTKDTDVESFVDEESRLSLTDIAKALKSINDEATIVEIELPEQISEDTRERLEQVATHFKAEAIKGTGNYVLCSCVYNIYKPEIADYNKTKMFKENDFIFFVDDIVFDRYFAILGTDIGRDVIYQITRIRQQEIE